MKEKNNPLDMSAKMLVLSLFLFLIFIGMIEAKEWTNFRHLVLVIVEIILIIVFTGSSFLGFYNGLKALGREGEKLKMKLFLVVCNLAIFMVACYIVSVVFESTIDHLERIRIL